MCAKQVVSREGGASLVPAGAVALSATTLLLGAVFIADRLMQRSAFIDEAPEHRGLASRLLGRLRTSARPATPMLDAFTRDMTAAAQRSEFDPVVGRDEEIERILAILARRSKNNPVLLGDPGVGKTAIVEGIAQRIASRRVPAALQGKRVLALAVSRLVAGTKYRGEFEGRVRRLLDEVRAAAREIVLFVDEVHILVGAGGSEGGLDLASMLKPELARGELQCIGATTFEEYRRHIESDAALERRFQPVLIPEPSVAMTVTILEALRERQMQHHGVRIAPEAIEAAARLSAAYLPDRRLPDKAIDLIDEAASTAALHGSTTIDATTVAQVLARWTGIPLTTLLADGRDVADLEERLAQHVIGQDAAIATLVTALRQARAGLKDHRRPIGSFFFSGARGVGKTALAEALARELFGSEAAFLRIDLSEYSEGHAISRLIGASPGYVGHGEPARLSEAVRRRPYTVVFFDDVERAHQNVLALLIEALEQGAITDATGRRTDLRQTTFIFASHLEGDALRRAVPSALLTHVDEVIPFRALERSDLRRLVTLQVEAVGRRLAARNITVALTDEALDFLVEVSHHSAQGGVRGVAHHVTRYVSAPLSKLLLEKQLPPGLHLIFDRVEETLQIRDATPSSAV